VNEPVCKPDPVSDYSDGDHPSGTTVTSSLVRSTSKHRASSPSAWASKLTLLTLLRVGFTELMQSPAPLVVSYTTVSPLPGFPLAVCFLWHFPADHSGWVLPTTLLYEVRTFLDTLLKACRDHPTDSFMPQATRSGIQSVRELGRNNVNVVLAHFCVSSDEGAIL